MPLCLKNIFLFYWLFNDKYYDLLQQRANGSAIFGADLMRSNIGINRYSGLEFQANWQGHFKNGISYFISLPICLIKK